MLYFVHSTHYLEADLDLNKLTLGDKIVAGAGILLFLDLLILPWHHISVSILGITAASFNRSGLQSPNALWGWLAWIITIALVASVILRKLTTVKLPDLPIAWAQATFFATIAVAALLLIKLFAETSSLGIGFWIAIILAAGMVYGGFLVSREPATAADAGPAV